MRLATVEQAIQIDELSTTVYGLTGEILMESAGALAAREIDLTFLPELTRGSVAVVAGPGNNGGDALVVARHLHSSGYRSLQIYILAPRDLRSSLFKIQLKRCELQGIRIVDLEENIDRVDQIKASELIIEGIFGIGLNRPISGLFLRLIETMNSCHAPKVSLDTPSGLNARTGRVEGAAVKSAMTVTFGLAKPGFFVSEGPSHVGKLRVLPIGFPHEALRGVATTHFLFTERLAKRYLPTRLETSNKSDHGHLLLIAGRKGFWGAGLLAGASGFRVGAGYVTWASFENPYEVLKEIPEVLTAALDDETIWDQKISSVAIGPGLGVSAEVARWIDRLKELKDIPVVVDADAITVCAQHNLFPLPSHWVITPHSGELARVLKVDVQDIERDRFRAAFEGYAKAQCHVLLKGYRSLIAFEKRCMIIHAGNSALAKAGTGDVLTGMIGGLLAQGLDTTQATATAAYLHGRLADEWLRSGNDKAALTASDLKSLLPQVISRLRLGGSLI